jgi:glutathione-independent formaldehyde dehydrogenase
VKAVVYQGPRQVSVKDVPDARIERPTDVQVRITTTNICGSDLHIAKNRQVAFDYGMYWSKGQHIGSGQAPVTRYNRQLRDLIAGTAEPSFIVSHELPLDQAPEAYQHLDARDEGSTKVALKPAMAGT